MKPLSQARDEVRVGEEGAILSALGLPILLGLPPATSGIPDQGHAQMPRRLSAGEERFPHPI